jgi:hypothetical protein
MIKINKITSIIFNELIIDYLKILITTPLFFKRPFRIVTPN